MKPKIIALNLLLAAALGAVVWQARAQWDAARANRRANLSAQLKPVAAPPSMPSPKPDAASAVKYADVATKDLFSADRNPNIAIDPPKAEAPKPRPPLPIVYGVLGLPSGVKAIMSEKKGAASVTVQVGDSIGEFKIAALDQENVTFNWEGERISKKIDDLIDRAAPAPQAASQAGPAAVQAGAALAAPPQPPKPPSAPVEPGPGPGGTCVPGDNSPSGTVVRGFRKNSMPTPFGTTCNWIPVQ